MIVWETTVDDVKTILNAHGISADADEIHDSLDHEAIEDGVVNYTDMDDQTSSMLSDIEDHLISNGTISGDKKFFNP